MLKSDECWEVFVELPVEVEVGPSVLVFPPFRANWSSRHFEPLSRHIIISYPGLAIVRGYK